MRGLVAALGLFTIIPVPVIADIDRTVARRAIAAFPWVGLLLGAAGGALMGGVTALGASPLLGAVVGLAVVAGLTGALHLDGLADTADGLGSRKPAAEALAIMRRSDIGPMGVVSLFLVVLVDVAALDSLAGEGVPVAAGSLAVAAMLGRGGVVLVTVSRASARKEGFGALFIGVTPRWSAALNGVAVLAVAVGLGAAAAGASGAWAFGMAAVAAGAVGLGWAGHLRRRLGGMTGDVFGSIVEVTQAAFLVAAALLVAVL